MNGLLLVAHGSRRGASNDEVRLLTQALGEKAGDRFGQVRCAFLELAEPSIPEGLEQMIQAGAERIWVLPYFLSAGRHVAEDIPREVDAKQREHPGVAIELAPYAGASVDMVDLLLGQVPA